MVILKGSGMVSLEEAHGRTKRSQGEQPSKITRTQECIFFSISILDGIAGSLCLQLLRPHIRQMIHKLRLFSFISFLDTFWLLITVDM